jgi:hypothetical protein
MGRKPLTPKQRERNRAYRKDVGELQSMHGRRIGAVQYCTLSQTTSS